MFSMVLNHIKLRIKEFVVNIISFFLDYYFWISISFNNIVNVINSYIELELSRFWNFPSSCIVGKSYKYIIIVIGGGLDFLDIRITEQPAHQCLPQ